MDLLDRSAGQIIRDLAFELRSRGAFASFDHLIPSDEDAIRLILRVVHDDACPRCSGRRWRSKGSSSIDCRRCGEVSVYAQSALHARRIEARILLAAIHGVFIDVQTPTARGFHRRHQLRLETAWRLLHAVRDALPYLVKEAGALHGTVLGGCNKKNAAKVALTVLGKNTITIVEEKEARQRETRKAKAAAAWWLARLRDWLNEHFRGVSAKHIGRYLAEHAARHGRVARAGALQL